MKRKLISTTFGLFFVLVLLSSCKDFLSETPTAKLSPSTVWSNPKSAKLFLNDIYNSLNAGPYHSSWINQPSQIINDPLANYTDDATYGPSSGLHSFTLFNSDSYGPSNLLFPNTWKIMYQDIRKCNLFIKKVSASGFDKNTEKAMLAQAHFLRAYFYKTLVDLYGGVPIITEVLNNQTQDSLDFPRSSYKESVVFIDSECTLAAQNLPQKWPAKDLGRATWGAAMAMKGEEELYAGEWKAASATNWEIMQSGIYSLFPSYAGLFYPQNKGNEEIIFAIQHAPNIRPIHINTYLGVPMISKGGGWGSCDPTQNLVSQYEYLDGKTAAEGSKYYDP
jgi:hypothetical protein